MLNKVIDYTRKTSLLTLVVTILFIGCSSTQEKTVPKKQYDELLSRYNKLKNAKKDPSEAIDEISIEKVDVVAVQPVKQTASKAVIENDIDKLRLAEKYFAVGDYEKASLILKQLASTTNRQVKVRGRFLMGEIMFVQKEYDQALQIFEDIIKNYGFSGVVIKTLNRLEICSKNLKLPKKQERYHSILHDIFES